MIIKSYEISKKKLDNYFLFLLYGENDGLKKDLSSSISLKHKKIGNIHKFEESEILNNPENIYNLIFSGSLFESFKICYINKVTDKSLTLIEDIRTKKANDIILIFIADNLDKKSKIRNLFEKDKELICIPCYADSQIDLNKIIYLELKDSKIKLSQEACNMIINRASGNRQNLRNEINKIKNYGLNKKSISIEDIKILTNLANNFENDEIVNFSLSGDKIKLKKMMEENNFSSEDFFIIQRILSKKIHRLIKIKNLQQDKTNTEQAISQIKPPIFWKEKDIVKKQANIWDLEKLNKIAIELNEVELFSKKNHEIGINITLNFLSNLCYKANSCSL